MKQLDWRIRMACAERGIWSATELQRLIRQKTGVRLSVQTLQAWFRTRPYRIEVRTLTAGLNALGFSLADLIHFDPPADAREAKADTRELTKIRSARAQTKRTHHTAGPDPDISGMRRILRETADVPLTADSEPDQKASPRRTSRRSRE